MKYDMEELLKKAFSQEEKPTKEFCQSVICKMKEREAKASFWETGWFEKKWMAAAVCAGVILLAGIGIRGWLRGNSPDQGRPSGQFAAEVDTPTPTATDSTGDADSKPRQRDPSSQDDFQENGERTGHGERDDQTYGQKGADQGNSSNGSLGEKPGASADQADKMEETSVSKTPVPDRVSPVSPAPGVSPVPETPSVEETATPSPMETAQPSMDYTSLCSIDTYSFVYKGGTSDEIQKPDGVTDGVCAEENVWEGLFCNKIISTYEQLQDLIRTAKGKVTDEPSDTGLQNMIGRLEAYDRDFFLSHALCVDIFDLDQEYDLKLASVTTREISQGVIRLSIQIDKIPLASDQGETSKNGTFCGCFIHVPKELAQNCSYVVMEWTP